MPSAPLVPNAAALAAPFSTERRFGWIAESRSWSCCFTAIPSLVDFLDVKSESPEHIEDVMLVDFGVVVMG
ncbi:hypothetical protein GCM10007857_30410 [Bradyrhizobium iriomotense]|uniref:Uncharacterized protein n=1 Tax=Bradyrhizobium iriomotense TaxID=441950 RepID=A0ABQ6AWD1_9BRAD|nr:hypothetical protein GCM10007857_30410 [Bradyrhizobium iriomotense]